MPQFNLPNSFLNLDMYSNPGEKVVGLCTGGSESLVLILEKLRSKTIFVRKISNERLISANWDHSGKGVMTPPYKKAFLQVDYLTHLPKDIVQYFPKIIDHSYKETLINDKIHKEKYFEVIYDEEFIQGLDVSSFVALYKPSPKIVSYLYKEIFKCLRDRIHKHNIHKNRSSTMDISYLEKIKKRIELAKRTAPLTFNQNLLRSESILINEIQYINIEPLLKIFNICKFKKILEPPFFSLVMGDTNTENIKISNTASLITAMHNNNMNLSYDDIGIKFVDPRAIGFKSVGRNTVDDYMYDNKPFHNSLGNYDVIHNEFFDIKMSYKNNIPEVQIVHYKNNPFDKSYYGLENYFKTIFEGGWNVNDSAFIRNDLYWLIRFVFIMGTHFLAMPPFHFQKQLDGVFIDHYLTQKRTIAIYCEGIKWMNLAYKMLNNEIKELYGIIIPKV